MIRAVRRERRPETRLASKMVENGTADAVIKIVDVTDDGIPITHVDAETDELIRIFNAEPIQRAGPKHRPTGRFGNVRRKNR